MTDEEKTTLVRSLIGDSTADVTAYLTVAKDKVLRRMYPFGTTVTTVPSQYEVTQCELAARLYLRKGAEGEISNNENGVSRDYDSVNDEDLLDRITPFIGTLAEEEEDE